MEYVKREPMKSASGREPTAFTMKAIKDLIAEDTSGMSEAPTMRTPLPKAYVQQPPHMRGNVPVVPSQPRPARKPALKASAAPRIDADITAPPQALPKIVQEHPAPAPAPRKRSILGRLISG
ncbi:hypothetical protein [Tateyamaria sp. SN6-1]|uniref:hypothetical protein n=1 Tax=Tateyamaria sp. SN6-1 TaxID=3092148 RepID=UPI0039F4CE54